MGREVVIIIDRHADFFFMQRVFNLMKNDIIKEAHRTQLVILERNKLKEDLRKNAKDLAQYTEFAEHTLSKWSSSRLPIPVACLAVLELCTQFIFRQD